MSSIKVEAVSAVRPEYPSEARANHITGTGVYVFHIVHGQVVSVEIALSSGHRILDDAAVSAFKRWRFKPGTTTMARIPVTWIMDR